MCVIFQSFLLFLNSQESSLLFLREDTVTVNEEKCNLVNFFEQQCLIE